MAWEIEKEKGGAPLYLSVCQYYKDLILEGSLAPGSKLPSLRKSAAELHLSRTTIESAYLQLAADGFVISRAQSGYYVTDIAAHMHTETPDTHATQVSCRYDLSSSDADRESFRFDLWQRYIKSALRQSDRLLSYGDAQGEPDFRETLSAYIREKRNVICSPDDIVVGASVQSLLHILCPLLTKYKTVSFPTPSFVQGSTVFEDYGFDVHYRDKNCGVIYVSPAHMTKWGAIMPISRRLELIRYAAERQSLIIEDDFENELVYLQKPTPSIYSLAGGEDVVYIGSFSRLLLPSIRISFMVLPKSLREAYHARSGRYNQTASKTEQIALCQFIRDGHLSAQTRKLKRIYSVKMKALLKSVEEVFGPDTEIRVGAAGTKLALTLPFAVTSETPEPVGKVRQAASPDTMQPAKNSQTFSPDALQQKAQAQGLRIQSVSEKEGYISLLLSCSSMPVEDFLPALTLLKEILQSL
jgi:GntR family transcriptional regulator/MocR family aminotransferase